MRRGRWGSGGVKQGSVHLRLVGGRALWLTEQSLGGWVATVLVAGVTGGCRWSHLGLKQREENRGGKVIELLNLSELTKMIYKHRKRLKSRFMIKKMNKILNSS